VTQPAAPGEEWEKKDLLFTSFAPDFALALFCSSLKMPEITDISYLIIFSS
jgi:hypothetical protein